MWPGCNHETCRLCIHHSSVPGLCGICDEQSSISIGFSLSASVFQYYLSFHHCSILTIITAGPISPFEASVEKDSISCHAMNIQVPLYVIYCFIFHFISLHIFNTLFSQNNTTCVQGLPVQLRTVYELVIFGNQQYLQLLCITISMYVYVPMYCLTAQRVTNMYVFQH